MKIQKICFQCNNPYYTYPSNIRNTTNVFCTMICYGKWQKGRSFKLQGKKIRPLKACTYEECGKKMFGHGYCKTHYSRIIELPKRRLKNGPKKPKIPAIIKSIECMRCNSTFKGREVNGIFPKFCSSKCFGLYRRKSYIIKKGYKKILSTSHPRADKKGYVFEHIIVMENHIGRPIEKHEEVHHIDKDRGNNNLDNLMLFPDHKSHMQYHRKNN